MHPSLVAVLTLTGAALAVTLPAQAQSYPTKPASGFK